MMSNIYEFISLITANYNGIIDGMGGMSYVKSLYMSKMQISPLRIKIQNTMLQM